MSQSTDGILFYGYCWDVEGRKPWVKEDDDLSEEEHDTLQNAEPEERYAIAIGLKGPKDEYPKEEDKSAAAEKLRKSYSAYWEKKNKAYAKSGCEMIFHCSCDCTMYGVAVSQAAVTANRGYPQAISMELIEKASGYGGEKWRKLLDDFCEKMGIDVGEQKPQWWLVSQWC